MRLRKSTTASRSSDGVHVSFSPPQVLFLCGWIQIVSEYLGEESFRLIGCFVSLVLSRCCGMELKGERSES